MTTQNEKKRLGVYVIRDRGEGKKPLWVRIGSAFENSDGSINGVLNANPIDGKFQIRELTDREADDGPSGS